MYRQMAGILKIKMPFIVWAITLTLHLFTFIIKISVMSVINFQFSHQYLPIIQKYCRDLIHIFESPIYFP